MLVYSKKIIRFIDEIKDAIANILSKEVRLKVYKNRFYDKLENYSYPIKVVIYNNKKMLGYFEQSFFELGFNELLMHASKEQLHHIIRHELAHYITFINFGNTVLPHGFEFKALCQRLGWNEEVSKATICLDEGLIAPEESIVLESSVLRKVQKLLALASSSNANESEQAMIKSQQLLLKHHIDSKYVDQDDDEKVFLKRILKQKKENAKMRAIAKILETFFVTTVYIRSDGYIHLEIVGSAINVEIAEYVANFLQLELDKQFELAKKMCGIKGMVAKNSFFLGIAKGYCNKVSALQREYNKEVSQALMIIEKKLIDAKTMVYRRLTSSKSYGSHCANSSALGEQVGRKLTINPGLSASKNTNAFLTYSS